MNWQLIETAPKDGTLIEVPMTVRWKPYKPQARKQGLPEGRWQWLNDYGGWNNLDYTPQRWVPSSNQQGNE